MKWLQKKGVRRKIGAILTYVIILRFLALLIGSIIPLLYNQITDFVKVIPGIVDTITIWIENFLDNIGNVTGVDIAEVKNNIFISMEEYGNNLTNSLPMMILSITKGIFSGAGWSHQGFGFPLLHGAWPPLTAALHL